ncbi:hypothetical protein [Siphonobacter sp. SORGH_AS_1065]|uniref:hypothetical protein n=1 Tax=Siphonobacter sp. SORGH_AS_1065 TaxID=3041795 RepID=UPI0027861FD7|nr:hypothetical protein [Siphonobacter sp. SORGH_AS_1065]MDQ1089755.1 hypothetical protein [Siphonobacter sp. SORGH_AS_1065]
MNTSALPLLIIIGFLLLLPHVQVLYCIVRIFMSKPDQQPVAGLLLTKGQIGWLLFLKLGMYIYLRTSTIEDASDFIFGVQILFPQSAFPVLEFFTKTTLTQKPIPDALFISILLVVDYTVLFICSSIQQLIQYRTYARSYWFSWLKGVGITAVLTVVVVMADLYIKGYFKRENCGEIHALEISDINLNIGTYIQIDCFSDNYNGLKQLNTLRKKIQRTKKALSFDFGIVPRGTFDPEDDDYHDIHNNYIFASYFCNSNYTNLKISGILFINDQEQLSAKPIYTTSKIRTWITYREDFNDLNRRYLQRFINTVRKDFEKKDHRNFTYQLVNLDGSKRVSITYDEDQGPFWFDFK